MTMVTCMIIYLIGTTGIGVCATFKMLLLNDINNTHTSTINMALINNISHNDIESAQNSIDSNTITFPKKGNISANLAMTRFKSMTSTDEYVSMDIIDTNTTTTTSPGGNIFSGNLSGTLVSFFRGPGSSIVAIISFALLDIGFDMGMALYRAFILECVPASQHIRMLLVASAIQSIAGLFYSFFWTIDFAPFFVQTFGVNGTAACIIFNASILSVVVAVCFSCTILTGYIIVRKRALINIPANNVAHVSTDGLTEVGQDHGFDNRVASNTKLLNHEDQKGQSNKLKKLFGFKQSDRKSSLNLGRSRIEYGSMVETDVSRFPLMNETRRHLGGYQSITNSLAAHASTRNAAVDQWDFDSTRGYSYPKKEERDDDDDNEDDDRTSSLTSRSLSSQISSRRTFETSESGSFYRRDRYEQRADGVDVSRQGSSNYSESYTALNPFEWSDAEEMQKGRRIKVGSRLTRRRRRYGNRAAELATIAPTDVDDAVSAMGAFKASYSMSLSIAQPFFGESFGKGTHAAVGKFKSDDGGAYRQGQTSQIKSRVAVLSGGMIYFLYLLLSILH